MHEHPSHELSKQAACSLTTKSYEEPSNQQISLISGSINEMPIAVGCEMKPSCPSCILWFVMKMGLAVKNRRHGLPPRSESTE
jgi:hypothetical protein